ERDLEGDQLRHRVPFAPRLMLAARRAQQPLDVVVRDIRVGGRHGLRQLGPRCLIVGAVLEPPEGHSNRLDAHLYPGQGIAWDRVCFEAPLSAFVVRVLIVPRSKGNIDGFRLRSGGRMYAPRRSGFKAPLWRRATW